MITTTIPDEMWCDFDCAISASPKPEGGITVADIMKKYKITESPARRKMDKAVRNGWTTGKFVKNGAVCRYILPPKEESCT